MYYLPLYINIINHIKLKIKHTLSINPQIKIEIKQNHTKNQTKYPKNTHKQPNKSLIFSQILSNTLKKKNG